MDANLLPPIAKLLLRKLGQEHALAVIRGYGGLPLYVPKGGLPPEMVARIGREAAAALCREFGGEAIGHVPKCLPALLAERNRAIVRAVAEGRPQTELAREHGICWRQIHNIAQGRRNGRDGAEILDSPQASPQADLFA